MAMSTETVDIEKQGSRNGPLAGEKTESTVDPQLLCSSSENSGTAGTAPAASPPPACSRNVSSFKQLGFLDRFLAVWIFLSMAVGIILGNFVPSTSSVLQRGQFAGVSVPIAIGLLVMMYPILVKVRYEALPTLLRDRQLWTHLLFSLLTNWLLAPLIMVAMAWSFLPDRPALREGLILVGVARCIAMVLVWTDLARGDGDYCAILVAANSLLQLVLFAPFTLFYVGVVSRSEVAVQVDYGLVAKSVGVFLGIPLGAAVATRFAVMWACSWDQAVYARRFVRWVAPWSLLGLLFTVLVLFAQQGRNVVHSITSVLRVAAPLVAYFVIVFAGTVGACRVLGGRTRMVRRDGAERDGAERDGAERDGAGRDRAEMWSYEKTVTQALTAASNNFELAIAVAVAVFGAESEQALAATVGPLVEVPVLLALVEVMKVLGRRWRWGGSGNGGGDGSGSGSGSERLEAGSK